MLMLQEKSKFYMIKHKILVKRLLYFISFVYFCKQLVKRNLRLIFIG